MRQTGMEEFQLEPYKQMARLEQHEKVTGGQCSGEQAPLASSYTFARGAAADATQFLHSLHALAIDDHRRGSDIHASLVPLRAQRLMDCALATDVREVLL